MPSPQFGFPPPFYGSPPFNPNAPDPRNPKGGLGLGRGLPQGGSGLLGRVLGSILGGGAAPQGPAAPQSPQPSAPDPLQAPLGGNPLQQIFRGIGDVSDAAQGRAGPTQRALEQRRIEYERKRQEFAQNLAVLDKFQASIESTPLDKVDARKAQLRKAYEQLNPQGGEMFDALLGDTGLSQARLEELGQDEGVKVIIAQGGSMRDILDYAQKSPDFAERTIERQDSKALPSVRKKVEGLLNSSDPGVRAELAKIAKDGSTTFSELETLIEQYGTEGPEGTKLTPGELGTYKRKQDVLAQLIPGLKADAAFAKEKDAKAKADLEVETQKRIGMDAAEIRSKLEAEKPQRSEGITPNKQADLLTGAQNKDATYRQSIAALDRALDTRVNGIKDIELIFQFISGLDETAAREGEVALAQKAGGLKGKVQALLNQAQGTGLVGEDARRQLREVLQITRDDIEKDRQLILGNYRKVAEGLGSDPSVLEAFDNLGKFGEKPKAEGAEGKAQLRSATDAEIETVQRELGENASEDDLLDALAAKGLAP